MNYFKTAKFFLYLVPFTVVIVSTSTLFPFIVGKYAWFRTSIDLSFFFLLLGLFFGRDAKEYEDRLKNWIRSPIGLAIGIFTVVFVLASFFGFDAGFSFWSNFERGEGGLQILHLFLFFILMGVLFKDEKDWRKIFWISVIAAFLMIFYGIGGGLKYIDADIEKQVGTGSQPVYTGKGGILFQLFKTFISSPFNEEGYRFHGSIGNPAYVATYLIFAIFYAGLLIFTSKKRILSFSSMLLVFFLLLFSAFFVFAGTRGAFVGIIISLFFGAIYLAIIAKPWRKKLVILIGLAILLSVALFVFKDTPFGKFIPALRIFDISFSARTLQDRIHIWRTALIGFNQRPILGWGPENFIYIFDHNFPKEMFTPEGGFGAWFDRAHSIYLDYLAETGILGLLAYLSIFGVFYLQMFAKKKSAPELINQNDRNQNKDQKIPVKPMIREYIIRAMIFAIPVAYLIQGLVLFEVLIIYLNMFLFLAFVNYKYSSQEMNTKRL